MMVGTQLDEISTFKYGNLQGRCPMTQILCIDSESIVIAINCFWRYSRNWLTIDGLDAGTVIYSFC